MNFCPKCGSKVIDRTAFCTKCGAALSSFEPVGVESSSEDSVAFAASVAETIPRAGLVTSSAWPIPRAVVPYAWVVLLVSVLAMLLASSRPGLLAGLYHRDVYDTVIFWVLGLAMVVSAVKILELAGAVQGIQVPEPWPASPRLAVFMPLVLAGSWLAWALFGGWLNGKRYPWDVLFDVVRIWDWWDFWRYDARFLFAIPAYWVITGCAVAITIVGTERRVAGTSGWVAPRPPAGTSEWAAQQPSPATSPVPVGAHGADGLPPTNSFAVVSLVLGVLGISLLAVIFGHISLGQIKRTGERGRGMALAGTILGWIGIAIGVILVIAVVAAASSYSSF